MPCSLLITSLNLSQGQVNVDLCPILGTYRGTLNLQKSSQSTFQMSLRCVLGGDGSTSASHLLLNPTPPSPLCCNPSMSIDSFNPHAVRQAQETIGTASGTVLRWSTQQAVSRVLCPSLSPYQLLFVWLVGFSIWDGLSQEIKGWLSSHTSCNLDSGLCSERPQSSKLYNVSHMNCYPRVERSKPFPPSSSETCLGVTVKVASSVPVNQLSPPPRKALIYSIGQVQ